MFRRLVRFFLSVAIVSLPTHRDSCRKLCRDCDRAKRAYPRYHRRWKLELEQRSGYYGGEIRPLLQ